MSWVRVDDHFTEHPKLELLGAEAPLAGWLHLAAMCYASRHLTDGFIPEGVVCRLTVLPRRVKVTTLVASMVGVGLWVEVEGGYQVHDYLVYNPSKVMVLAKRRAWAARQRRSRGESHESHGVTSNNGQEMSRMDSLSPLSPFPIPLQSKG